MKIEISFRIIKRLYGDSSLKFTIQEYHPDFEWMDIKTCVQPFETLEAAKGYKEAIIKHKKKSQIV